ncbi:MAG: type II toxin-antitoxin system VapC family toxin [Candidatus Sericytochromatia bacterium]|nr:type II toxin-antitoxin system VapC family toxin [Candidatus Tanganyikabacteria bacterium]
MDVFLDSSGALALVDGKDDAHERARRCLVELRDRRASVYTTNFVRTEAHALIGSRVGWDFARRWLADLDLPIETVRPVDEKAAIETILRQSDKTYSLTDATSFAVMARLQTRHALTLDRHFRQAGFETFP